MLLKRYYHILGIRQRAGVKGVFSLKDMVQITAKKKDSRSIKELIQFESKIEVAYLPMMFPGFDGKLGLTLLTEIAF